jgi:hypothetical protein
MQTRQKSVLPEIIWIIALLTISVIGSRFMFTSWVANNSDDSSFRLTDHTSMQWKIAFPFFLLLTFITFFIKALTNSFGDRIKNIIAIISGLILIISLMLISNLWLHAELFLIGGWTSYPPLSALSDEHNISVVKIFATIQTISFIVMALQLSIIACLLFLTYSWGIKKRAG